MILKATSRCARWGRRLFLHSFGCSCSHLPVRNNLLITSFATGLLIILSIGNANAIQISTDTQIATAGYFQLHWSGKNKIFQLQESTNSGFQPYRLVYEGMDLARVVSGKPDGDYFYRVADAEDSSHVSNVIKVTVLHHPLKNAVLFFIAGAIVFISILVLIYRGNKQANG